MMYTMFTRTGSIVTRNKAENLEEAIDFFAKMKKLSKKEFLKLFLVTESK